MIDFFSFQEFLIDYFLYLPTLIYFLPLLDNILVLFVDILFCPFCLYYCDIIFKVIILFSLLFGVVIHLMFTLFHQSFIFPHGLWNFCMQACLKEAYIFSFCSILLVFIPVIILCLPPLIHMDSSLYPTLISVAQAALPIVLLKML